ncbi:hypothetical protein [Burkholderia guangdongensis]|uniref:hypothetical protein n=1 Tax=Burkholderia guangdongensis TaxID=1792500 RepID=UPI0015CCB39C|nr:hypothetical protein [Burkholderia guangdongensis]
MRIIWKTYVRAARDWADNPVAFVVDSYLALVFTAICVALMCLRTLDFWASAYDILFSGAAALLCCALCLLQIKSVKNIATNPAAGLFLVGTTAFFYQDSHDVAVYGLNEYFPFAVSQLSEAINTGTLYILAITIARLSYSAIFIFVVAMTLFNTRKQIKLNSMNGWVIPVASLGAILSLLILSSAGDFVANSFGLELFLVRQAYALDFTSSYRCDGVPRDDRVLLSKMSDTVGYALHLTFPDRPLLRIRKTDKDAANSIPNAGNYRVVTCNTSMPKG